MADGLGAGDGEAVAEGGAAGDPLVLGEAWGETVGAVLALSLGLGDGGDDALGDGVDVPLGDAEGAVEGFGDALVALGVGVGSAGTMSSAMESPLSWTRPSASLAVMVKLPGSLPRSAVEPTLNWKASCAVCPGLSVRPPHTTPSLLSQKPTR